MLGAGMRFDIYCRPILPTNFRKPVYVVVYSAECEIDQINRIHQGIPYLSNRKPRRVHAPDGTPSLFIPSDRYIRPGAIINPTRELKRVLNHG